MKHTRTVTVVLVAAASLILAGCSSGPPKADGRPATACENKTWPQKIPAVVGKPLTDAVDGPLLCFNITRATAPDGHDALQDSTTDATQWIINSVTPAAGTRVTEHQAVTLTVAPDN
ncbi:hypothetical protein ACFYN0_02980 [Streptomyces sp. NPDC006704]|uniref:hypothetical protein n=1 Tax=Streptomyces sp. NPDC006704 TaxID=3364760 RepID=UPI0036BAFC8E